MTHLERGLCLAVALVVLALPAPHALANEQLVVYTALEADQLKAYKGAFEKAHPEIEIRWVRDSTGIITAKLLAEKRNPRADVIWGLAASSLMLLGKEGMLQPYTPKGLDQLKPSMRDPGSAPAWFGLDVWSSAICFNTIEAEKRKLPKPAAWSDLVNPAYKGQIAMPNPASSGTGYLMVSAWIQLMGEDKAWAYMDALHQNVAAYTHSGSKPCRQAGAGEYAVGISFEYRANVTKKDGAPIDIVLPKEGLGWDMEAVAIAKNTKKLEAAKKLVDWAISRPANELYAQNFAVVALPGLQPKLEFIPGDIEKMLIKNNFTWAAENRERILAEWAKRYDGKSEAKK